MAQIRIDTEHTREIGRRLIAEADRMAEIGSELQNAIGSLDTGAWDGRSRSRAEPLLNRARPQGVRVAEGLDGLGRKLVRVAEVFEGKDNTAARELGDLGWVDFTPKVAELPQTGGGTSIDSTKEHISDEDLRSFSNIIDRIKNDFEALLDVFWEKLPFLKGTVKEVLDTIKEVLEHWQFWKAWHKYSQADEQWLNNQASYDELLDAKNEFIKSLPGFGTAIGLMDIAAVIAEQAAKLAGHDEIAQLAQDFQDHLEEVDVARGIEDTLYPPSAQ